MGVLLGFLLSLCAAALVVALFWQELRDFWRARTGGPGDEAAAAIAAEMFGDRAQVGEAGVTVQEECRPIETAHDRGEVEALDAFVRRLDLGLAGDDPAVWPDDQRGIECLARARALMDEAEQVVERLATRSDAGRAAAALLDEATGQLLAAKEHWSSGAACRAALSRAVWIRSRGTGHRYRRMGLVAAMRLANEALERDPKQKEAEVMRARTQVALGKLGAARIALIELMARHPSDPDVIRTRSRWLWAHGDVRGACDAVLDVLPAMPVPLAAAERLRIGPGLLKAGRFREAAEVYGALLAWRADLPEVHAGLARCLLEARDLAGAERAAKRSLEIEPTAAARDVLRAALTGQGRQG